LVPKEIKCNAEIIKWKQSTIYNKLACILLPFSGTVAFSHSLGYLLCWRVVLCLLEHSSDIVRPRFSQYLQSNEHITKLLGNYLFYNILREIMYMRINLLCYLPA
jgi:hypothetical protein